jgi:hypothetical protein
VSSIDDRDPPFLNWVYIDRDSYELKYGVRAQAQPNLIVPFDCTKHERRLTFDGWEGFYAIEEATDTWGLYFDRDRDGLKQKVQGRTTVEVQLSRKEQVVNKSTSPTMSIPAPTTASNAIQERSRRRLNYRTGTITFKRPTHSFESQQEEKLPLNFNPSFTEKPQVMLGLTGWTLSDPNTRIRAYLGNYESTVPNATPLTESSTSFFHLPAAKISDAQGFWLATTDDEIRTGFLEHKEFQDGQLTQSRYRKDFWSPKELKYDEPPKVICCITAIDYWQENRYCVVKAFADEVDKNGFTSHVWWLQRLNAKPNVVWTRYFAIPKGKRDVDVGMATVKITQDDPKQTSTVAFEQGKFKEPPGRVKIFLNEIYDFDRELHTGFSNDVGKITETGFEWIAHMVSRTSQRRWTPVTIGISWIALE